MQLTNQQIGYLRYILADRPYSPQSARVDSALRELQGHLTPHTQIALVPTLTNPVDWFGSDFGGRFRLLRRAAGFKTQVALAKAIGVSVKRISEWETGRKYPSAKHFAVLAARTRINVGSLFGRPEEAP